MEKDFTIEELREMLKAKEKEEAEKKKAKEAARLKKLSDEKESRKREIELYEKKLRTLYENYIRDYGSISITRKNYDDFLLPFFKRWWF